VERVVPWRAVALRKRLNALAERRRLPRDICASGIVFGEAIHLGSLSLPDTYQLSTLN
jgi:hypothetical protein